jgi:DNA polymerase-3 subunit epsilon
VSPVLAAIIVAVAMVAVAALVAGLHVRPLRRMARETRLIASGANPGHRLDERLLPPAGALAAGVNELAERSQAAERDVAGQIAAARADLEQERNRLAALMSELTPAVLVCNVEGQILLYNAAARRLLDGGDGVSGPVGLGRSLFGVLDRSLIGHALERLPAAGGGDGPAAPVRLAATTPGGRLLRVAVAPVAGDEGRLGGFVMTLEDVTRRAESGARRDALLRSLTEGTRASVGAIRAAIETVLAYPDMEPAERERFLTIIRDEAVGLGARVEEALRESAEHLRSEWRLAEILGRDLLAALRRALESELALEATAEDPGSEVWLELDSYAVVRAATQLAAHLRADAGAERLTLALGRSDGHARLDLAWPGPPPEPENVRAWTEEPLAGAAPAAASVREVLDRHGGEAWCEADAKGGGARLRLLLPLAPAPPSAPAAPPAGGAGAPRTALGSRPEFYDFDLFRAAGGAAELDQRRLDELAYTVFDTETTGLNPSAGDEIISIGAVRVVNGRLLRQEIFDQLVDPRRPVSPLSAKLTGIRPELLEGQPPIYDVLPAFARFCEDTVLVGHNVGFDLRFLELKEARTGVRLDQPVLDTLLLSAALEPEQDDHSLEALAARLGVSVVGRHTALGDAILTGEIFLRQLRLLAAQRVVTLGEARAAARSTYLARMSESLYSRA